jgi:hypothetical protein
VSSAAAGSRGGGTGRRRTGAPVVPSRHPYRPEILAERVGWYEFAGLIRRLTRKERLEPGYYADPAWSVRDLAGHIGTWLAEAQIQIRQISADTYEGHDVDIDGMNAAFLEAMRGQPWEIAWVQATAGRAMMLEAWYALAESSDEAAWWIRKSAAEHYAEHLERLRAWTAELLERRAGAKADKPG